MDQPNQSSVPVPEFNVVLYCSSWCPSCRRARTWLEEHHIAYSEMDVYSSKEISERVKKWANGNLTTPTFDIDGTIVVDFDEEKLVQIFNLK